MSRRRSLVALLAVALGIVLAGEIWGWPILRTARYRALLEEYSRALAKPAIRKGREPAAWDFEISPNGVRIRVESRGFMDVVRLHYADEPEPRTVYEYVDYSNVVAIKTAGNMLYVHWAETLIHTDHWLLAYDLASRRELNRRRVDPADILDRN